MLLKYSDTDRKIFRLAIPNVISNISVPLLGMADTAIAGRLGDDANIAALSIGTTIFNFIYWNCGFLRMGTSGITAQAYGARNHGECANMLVRAVWLALIVSFLLLVFQQPIGRFSLMVMQGGDKVQALASEYFFARIWAVPASILLFSIQGWYIGMQDARTPMYIAILSNIINILFSIWFVFGFGMGIAGVAWGTVVAQYCGLLMAVMFWIIKYRGYSAYFDIRISLKLGQVIHFLHINKDIFLRTLCVVITFTFFTAASARFGDVILTTNALMMQLFTLFSYMSDGFAYAAEALSGRFVGERNADALQRFIRRLMGWALLIAIVFVGIYIVGWKEIMMLFSPSEEIIETIGQYIGWVIAVPLVGAVPFMIDGIMIGATRTKIMRNTVFISTLLYLVCFYALSPWLGNTALWIAFLVFLSSRGILLYFGSDRLNVKKIINGDI